MDWDNVWSTIAEFFSSNVWNIVAFFAALVIGMIVIKIVVVIFRKIFARTKVEEVARNFILAIVKFVLWLILILILLSIMGVQMTGVIAALSAAILAIGMALQSNIANIANGIVIVVTKMFKKGDYITVGDKEGNIVEINFLFTTLFTPDNKKVTIPNSTIVNSAVVNAGANPKRRVNFTFPVAYDSDVDLVKSIVIDVMTSNGKIYLDPAPFCKLKEFGASSIDFFANCWCDSPDYWDVYYYVMENVFNEFKRHGISIPFTQLEVRQLTGESRMPYREEPLPERVEKERPAEAEPALKRAYEGAKKAIEDTFKKKPKKDKNAENIEQNDDKK
ncbi:MAG: mechanosensitive ion channel family protein [Clostridia bacterium]|nr:mechanosensitive ion channel family protein [Clostridia bacterium]